MQFLQKIKIAIKGGPYKPNEAQGRKGGISRHWKIVPYDDLCTLYLYPSTISHGCRSI